VARSLRACRSKPWRGFTARFRALVTQSYLKDEALPDALAWIASGSEPDAVLAALIDPVYDADFGLRQYAVVSADGRAVGFTGEGANPHASNIVSSTADFSVAIQGNYLTGPDLIDQARAAFEDGAACDLPERLMRALEAAGSNGAGDARCIPDGSPAESALIQVDPPNQAAGTFLRLGSPVGTPDGSDPVPLLRGAFDSWRESHPCPAPEAGPPGGPPRPADPGSTADPGCALGRPDGAAAMPLILLGLVGAFRRRRFA
jgi:MYXO-CTERM domain-containing protein